MAKNNRDDEEWGQTGQAALERMNRADEEHAKRKARGFMPLRFWLSNTPEAIKKGDNECELVILDDCVVSDKPGKGAILIREHNLQGPDGKWGNHESCAADFDDCPICAKTGKEGYHILFLTVLVLKPWESKDKKRSSEYSKMLLPIFLSQRDTFLDLQKHALKSRGTMRGMKIRLRRGKDSKRSIGEPVLMEDGNMFKVMSEKWLEKWFGHEAVISRDGKTVLKEANEDIQPFDYKKLFPKPDVEELRERFGGKTRAGSKREFEEEFPDQQTNRVGGRRRFDDDDDDPEDDIPGNAGAAAKKQGAKGRFADDEDEPEETPAAGRAGKADADEGDDDPPVRSRRPSTAREETGDAPVRSRRTGGTAAASAAKEPIGDDDPDDPDADDGWND